MQSTTTGVVPGVLLTALRQANPQFAEMARGKGGMGGYAQQGVPSFHYYFGYFRC